MLPAERETEIRTPHRQGLGAREIARRTGRSRAASAEFVTDERLESLPACHEAAFASFGGTSREALHDNMRTVMVGRDAYGPGPHRCPARLPRLRPPPRGFLPRLCRPCRAATTGKAERFIRCLHFWAPPESRLRPLGLRPVAATANMEGRTWLRDVAKRRGRATTGRVPADVLTEECRVPLPWPGLVPRPAVATVTARPTSRSPAPAIQRSFSVCENLLAPRMPQ